MSLRGKKKSHQRNEGTFCRTGQKTNLTSKEPSLSGSLDVSPETLEATVQIRSLPEVAGCAAMKRLGSSPPHNGSQEPTVGETIPAAEETREER